MNIGIVSAWLHRGAAYVTINYAKLLQPEHQVFVYGRGGEYFDDNMHEEGIRVHKGYRIDSQDGILFSDFVRWIKENRIDMVIWNEQRNLSVICQVKKTCPRVVHGAYIDYYKENMISDFAIYDFLICNTKRHYSVFKWHRQAFYIPWGCDVDIYKPQKVKRSDKIVFFHSMGMSNRKGTDILIKTFIDKNMKQYGARLVIHSQVNIDHLLTEEDAIKYGIDVINKTVEAPGLYFLGDVYVYPAKLDGLGLTMYEAISCGLPVIATDVAPMNEVITNNNGRLIKVNEFHSRNDGYYWPLAEVNEESLYEALMYYVQTADRINDISMAVRQDAVLHWNLKERKDKLLEVVNSVVALNNDDICLNYMARYKKNKRIEKRSAFIKLFVPKIIFSHMKNIKLRHKYLLKNKNRS
jgi:glycosyltransferase involved in cell wall biosynthesis